MQTRGCDTSVFPCIVSQFFACNQPCGSYGTTTCVGTPTGTPYAINWVGGKYTPVNGHPRLRGMTPRGVYGIGPSGCSCTSTSGTCFSSTQFNTCLMYYPRPPSASIFARGETTPNLDYRGVFFDMSIESVFEPTAAGAPYFTPPFSGTFDAAGATFGNASGVGGYGNADFAASFCANNNEDFCTGLAGWYSSRMLTSTSGYRGSPAGQDISDSLGGFAGVLARYYGALVGRPPASGPARVTGWLDAYFWNVTSRGLESWAPSTAALCALVGHCAGATRFLAPLEKPAWSGVDEARAAYYTSPDTIGCRTVDGNEYCHGGTSAWLGNANVPFYDWHRYAGTGVRFGWGEYRPLLQQVQTAEATTPTTTGFSSSFTDEWLMFGTAMPSVPNASWCWTSPRGMTADTQSSPLGLCATQHSCYHRFFLGDRLYGELGCLDIEWTPSWTEVQVDSNTVLWSVNGTGENGVRCWATGSERVCVMPPGIAMTSENTLGNVTGVSATNSTRTVYDATSAACGCTTTDDTSSMTSPAWLCRAQSTGHCYVSPTATCTDGDFNCGTQFGFGDGDRDDYSRLCTVCTTPTVGQCTDSTGACSGLLNNGSCVFGSTLCTTRAPAYVFPSEITAGSFASAISRAGGPLVFLWNGGGDLFGKQTTTATSGFPNISRWVVSAVSQTSTIDDTSVSATYDTVHCNGVFGPDKQFFVVETPNYLRGDTTASADFPGSLTEDALDAWCSVPLTDCSRGIRRALCIDSGQSIDTPTPERCRLRREWVSDYTTYTNAKGQKIGLYSGTSARRVSPDCASWVSGLDPDSDCQRRDAFTGCVISRVGLHEETLLDGTNLWRGVTPTSDWTVVGTGNVTTCSDQCSWNAQCVAWHTTSTTCTLYNESKWTFLEGSPTDRVGSAYAVTGGILVPRTHAGPVFEMLTASVQQVYNVSGIELFVMSADPPQTTAKVGQYTNVTCSGVLQYYGSSDGSSAVQLLNTTATCTSLVDPTLFESSAHKFPAPPLIVRVEFGTPVWMLGLLAEDWNADGYVTGVYNEGVTGNTSIGRGRGLRGVLRDAFGGSFVLNVGNLTHTALSTFGTRARWVYDSANQSVVVPRNMMRTHTRACVPVALRKVVTESTLSDQAGALTIIRRNPVDCVVAGSVSNDAYVTNVLFGNGGQCAGGQGLEWPSTAAGPSTDAYQASSLRYFSWWSWVVDNGPAPIFYDTSGQTSYAVNGATLSANLLASSRPPAAVPNCGVETSACELAYDLAGFIPCTGGISTVWFSCMKPTMANLYPLYTPDFSAELSTPFYYPDDLYVTAPTYADLTENSTWTLRQWSQYITQVHYCDRYVYDGEPDLGDDGVNGWRPGRFVACENDPLSPTERVDFCRTKQPWWVVSGLVFVQFSFNDLCPFATGAGVDKYCFVFADHPQFSTTAAFLSASLPDGLTWELTTFYYVPFTLRVLKLLLFDAYVVNTLITNNLFSEGIRLTLSNYDQYGPAAQLFAEQMLLNGGTGDLCTSTLTPEMMRTLYAVVRGHYDAGTDSYTFGVTAAAADGTTTLAASEVDPVFQDVNSLLDYSGLTVRGLVDGVPARIALEETVTINQVTICTRFQINGNDVTIHNIVFDQSKCTLTGTLRQTPIVFSGEFAKGSAIFDIEVIESAAAVAVIGGDALVYTYSPTIDADGLIVYDVRFTYGASSTIPQSQRRTVAVFGRMTGIPTVTFCRADAPSGFSRLANCFIEYYPTPGARDCFLPNECVLNNVSECCGRSDIRNRTIDSFGCEYGRVCVGNVSDINRWYELQPNARVLCNQDTTGCPMSDAGCVTAPDDTCYYDRSPCQIQAAGDIPLPDSFQSWQYNGSLGLWYTVTPSYPSARFGGLIDFVDGIGYGQLVWTVRSNLWSTSLETPEGLSVEAHVLPTVAKTTHYLDSITIIPSTSENLDTVMSDRVQLVLQTEWFFATLTPSDYNASFLSLLQSTEWCVGVKNGALRVVKCSEPMTQWYLDGVTSTFHVSGHPMMCPTAIIENSTAYNVSGERAATYGVGGSTTIPGSGAPLYWIPCRACFIGTERVSLPDTVSPDSTQMFMTTETTVTAAITPNAIVSTNITARYAHRLTAGSSNITYLLDSQMRCATWVDGNYGWEPCTPDLLFPNNVDLCTQYASLVAVGVFRYACTQGAGGTISDAAPVDPLCVFPPDSPVVSANGLGGEFLRLDNGSVSVVFGGDGYMNGETVLVDSCSIVVYTAKALFQPQTTNFSVASAGVEIINMTLFTGLTGDPIQIVVPPPSVHYENIASVIDVILDFSIAVLSVMVVVGFIHLQLQPPPRPTKVKQS